MKPKTQASAGGRVGQRLYLDGLRGGQCGVIVGVEGESDAVTRLQALGFLPGREVRHRNTAPLGDPVAFAVAGQKVSMRRTEARLVEIRLVESEVPVVRPRDEGGGK
jgi:ferrous iron transport protein A